MKLNYSTLMRHLHKYWCKRISIRSLDSYKLRQRKLSQEKYLRLEATVIKEKGALRKALRGHLLAVVWNRNKFTVIMVLMEPKYVKFYLM